jgi:hypothetical protein
MTDAERIATEWHRVHQRMSAYHSRPARPRHGLGGPDG